MQEVYDATARSNQKRSPADQKSIPPVFYDGNRVAWFDLLTKPCAHYLRDIA